MRYDLRNWLREKSLTQTQLAEELEMNYNYVATICRGDVPMSPSFRLRFIDAYGIDPVTVASDATMLASTGQASGRNGA